MSWDLGGNHKRGRGKTFVNNCLSMMTRTLTPTRTTLCLTTI
jgi:hypothetical protein